MFAFSSLVDFMLCPGLWVYRLHAAVDKIVDNLPNNSFKNFRSTLYDFIAAEGYAKDIKKSQQTGYYHCNVQSYFQLNLFRAVGLQIIVTPIQRLLPGVSSGLLTNCNYYISFSSTNAGDAAADAQRLRWAKMGI